MGARYKKGSDFERFVVNSFWERGWVALRAAGSGKTDKPLPDVVAVKGGKIILIECKTTTKDRLSLKAAVENLFDFSRIAGGEAYLAVRFFRQRARFYNIMDLIKRGNYTINEKDEFINFDTILGEQAQLI